MSRYNWETALQRGSDESRLQSQILSVAYPIIIILGLAGNIVNVAIFARPLNTSATCLYLLLIAIVDTVVLLAGGVSEWLLKLDEALPGDVRTWEAANHGIYYLFPVTSAADTLAVYLIIVAALHCAIKPNGARNACQCCLAIAVPVVVVLCKAPDFFQLRMDEYTIFTDYNATTSVNVSKLVPTEWRRSLAYGHYRNAETIGHFALPILMAVVLLVVLLIRRCRYNESERGRDHISLFIPLLVALVFTHSPWFAWRLVKYTGVSMDKAAYALLRNMSKAAVVVYASVKVDVYALFYGDFKRRLRACCRRG